jgi:RelA/SpoT family (p)ppGpp synthetase
MQWNEFRTHVRHLPTRDQERIRKAFDLAKELHKDQLRKSGEPYFMHPLAVATMLAEMHADADSLVTAFLHDSIEDTVIELDEIKERFGEDAAMLIDGVTKLCKEELQDFPTLDQEIESLRKIFTYMEKDIRIMVIKLADRLHNMQTVEFLAPERQASLAQETLDIYVRIADRLSMQDLRDELEGLCITILEPELAMTLQELRLRNEHRGEDIIKKHLKVLHKSALTLPPHLELRYERKTWKNLRAQANEEGNTATGLSTLTTVFLNDTVSECYETLGIIHQQWPYEILSFKDFISAPAINGYKGLHTTIILQDGTRVRCKIRTREMHEYARKGVAALCFDAKTIGLTHYLPWAKRISPLSKDTAERSEEFWESLQSDILGKSIMVYGHDDSAMQLPKGATALDGIFYLFGRQGIRTKEIQINGKTVDFAEELPNACRLNATFSSHEEAALPWLQYVHTGIASALIRQGLARAPHAQKIDIGEALIRGAIRQRS